MEYKTINKCRICGTTTKPYINYGDMPLVNQLYDTREDALNAPTYPLELYYCPECLNSQLSVVVDPDVLYSHNYPYRSSVSKPFRAHCHNLAEKIEAFVDLSPDDIVVDIAGNDGAFMREMVDVSPKIRPFIIDPSEDVLRDAKEFKTICSFWGRETGRKFREVHGMARVIVAQNVVAHVHDLDDFFAGIAQAMRYNGVFIVEVPHALDFISNVEFDTVYHEHLSVMTVKALREMGRQYNLEMVNVEKVKIHCGTIRCWFRFGDENHSESVNTMIALEEKIMTPGMFDTFEREARLRVFGVREKLLEGYRHVIGVAASAKGNVLLNMVGTSKIKYLVDDTPAKIGKFSPGIELEIKKLSRDNVQGADLAIILARNFEAELTRRLHDEGFTGEVYCP